MYSFLEELENKYPDKNILVVCHGGIVRVIHSYFHDMTSEEVKTLVEANDKMKICSFLWVYYGYPTSCYEGRNVEEMRYECGRLMAQRDDIKDIDLVAGVPDSGIAHAIGYSNESHIQYG